MSTNQPSGQPVGGWEGATTCQNSNAGSFFGNWRGGVGLRRAIVARLWGCHVIAPAPPSIPRIILLGLRRWGPHQKNSSKLEFWTIFLPTAPAKHASERTPIPPKLGHRTASRGGGEGGGGGRNRPKLEFWRLFGRRHLFKSSRIQDSHAPGTYFHPAVSRSPTATTTLHHTACGSMVATGYAKTRAAFEFWRFFCS